MLAYQQQPRVASSSTNKRNPERTSQRIGGGKLPKAKDFQEI